MSIYYVYNTDTGQIVHAHETYSAVGGTSLQCSREEVLALVDETLNKEKLDILEAELDRRAEAGGLRVDTAARKLITTTDDS
jgi:hypothetical protein